MPPTSSKGAPKAYLVKEIQRVIAFVICNHMNKKSSMQKRAQCDLFFNHYHGTPGEADPAKIPFVKQAIQALSVFECLFDMENTPVIARLTDSPIRPVRFRINPLLIPGADLPVYVGVGPTADIRIEHLEMASLGGKNTTLISGRTLLRMADAVKLDLRKVEPIAKECMNKDGTLPSGEDKADFLKKLAAKLVEYKATGLFVEGDDNENADPPHVEASLTQGIAAAAVECKRAAKAKWTHKMIPVTGWISIALFCKFGLVRAELEDTLPLLKCDDYAKQEKKLHSRMAARMEDREAKSRARCNNKRKDLSTGGYDTKDHLLASVVTLMADNNESTAAMDAISSKRDEMRLLHNEKKDIQWRIERYIQMGKDCNHLFEEHDKLLDKWKALRDELATLVEEQTASKRSKEDATENARKLARLVQGETISGVIPEQVDKVDTQTNVSALGLSSRSSTPSSHDRAVGNDQLLSLFTQRSASDSSNASTGKGLGSSKSIPGETMITQDTLLWDGHTP